MPGEPGGDLVVLVGLLNDLFSGKKEPEGGSSGENAALANLCNKACPEIGLASSEGFAAKVRHPCG